MPNRSHAWLQVCAATAAWVVLFQLNAWLFSSVEWAPVIIDWLFLPASVRLLAVMLFGRRGAIGLWIGTLVTNEGVFGDDLLESLTVATLSVAGPLLAVYLTMRWLDLPLSLKGLTGKQLMAFALMGALCNVIPHNVFFWLAGITPNPFAGLLPMFIGDLLGIAIVLYLLRSLLVLIDHITHPSAARQ
jgi:hypothetical protein